MKKGIFFSLSLILIAVLVLSFATGCSSKNSGAPKEIVIGNPTSLTGNFASAGI